MYSFTGATYPGGQSQALPGYSRFTPGPPVPACNSSLHSPGNNPLTLFTGNTPLIPPLPKRSQASVATSHLRASESPQKSQVFLIVAINTECMTNHACIHLSLKLITCMPSKCYMSSLTVVTLSFKLPCNIDLLT